MSGITQRDRGGNRRNNRRNVPSGGFRNNRIQPQLPQQLIHPSFSHDSSNKYITVSENQQSFVTVGQLAHSTIINGRPNMSIPPPPLTYPFLQQNMPPNGTTVAYIAQPQYLPNQSTGIRFNGTYQSFVPTITIPQNSQSSSGSQGPVSIQGCQSYQNSQPYTPNIQGVALNQQYSSNHPPYPNTSPSFATIPSVPNFQHIQPVVAVHSLPSILPSFPGVVSQNIVPLSNSIIHPITATLHTISHEPKDVTALGGVQFATPGQNNEKKDEVKREKREKVPLKILHPDTNEEIIDTPPDVKPKSEVVPKQPKLNTNNVSSNMFVIHSPVMVPNPMLFPNQQVLSQPPIIPNGIHPIHFSLENHQIITNSHYIPNLQLQRNETNINLDAATENFHIREHNNRNGNSHSNSTNSSSGEENCGRIHEVETRIVAIPTMSNVDSNNNSPSVTNSTNSCSPSLNTQEPFKNLSPTNNYKFKKAAVVGSSTYCINNLPNNLYNHSEGDNDKNNICPDNRNRFNGIKNKKTKKFKNNTRDSISYPLSTPFTFKGERAFYRSISSNTKRNYSSVKEHNLSCKNKSSTDSEELPKIRLQNLLTYNFESLTIKNISLLRGKKQISIMTDGNLNQNYQTSLKEIFSSSRSEPLVDDNNCNITSIDSIGTHTHDYDIKNHENVSDSLENKTDVKNDSNIKIMENIEKEKKKEKVSINMNNDKNKSVLFDKDFNHVIDNQPGPSNIPICRDLILSTSTNKSEEEKSTEDEGICEQKKKKDKKKKGQNKGYGDKYNNFNRKKR